MKLLLLFLTINSFAQSDKIIINENRISEKNVISGVEFGGKLFFLLDQPDFPLTKIDREETSIIDYAFLAKGQNSGGFGQNIFAGFRVSNLIALGVNGSFQKYFMDERKYITTNVERLKWDLGLYINLYPTVSLKKIDDLVEFRFSTGIKYGNEKMSEEVNGSEDVSFWENGKPVDRDGRTVNDKIIPKVSMVIIPVEFGVGYRISPSIVISPLLEIRYSKILEGCLNREVEVFDEGGDSLHQDTLGFCMTNEEKDIWGVEISDYVSWSIGLDIKLMFL